MLLYTRNLILKIPACILRKYCQITFLRTFGSRRPPTLTEVGGGGGGVVGRGGDGRVGFEIVGRSNDGGGSVEK
jgi:hypothetical protein